ncbi:MAG TPA: phage minor head protein [Gammaproteobacteria bacterium]|nr:phage minor head protein [Gammaproteobacteria bacterium]
MQINKARRLAQTARPLPKAPDYYELAGRHVARMARAFQFTMQGALHPLAFEELQRRAAVRSATTSLESIVAALPWHDTNVEENPLVAQAWSPKLLEIAYSDLLAEVPTFGVEKRRAVPRVRVNPRSLEWARERGGRLIRGISADTRETVRNIVGRSLQRGERADTMAAAIRRAVGLLPREEAAVDRRRSLLEAQDITPARVEALSDKYAGELLEARAMRIARTETIAAQNMGLLGTWQDAVETGRLPATVQRVWAAAPPSDNPNRPCSICIELDDKATGLEEPFYSEELGEDVVAPPAHPNCRCTMKLQRGES